MVSGTHWHTASLASMPVAYASLALARCEHASRERASRGRMTDRSVNNSGHVGAEPTRAVAREHASRRATLCRAPRTGYIATLQCERASRAPTLSVPVRRPRRERLTPTRSRVTRARPRRMRERSTVPHAPELAGPSDVARRRGPRGPVDVLGGSPSRSPLRAWRRAACRCLRWPSATSRRPRSRWQSRPVSWLP
jgi:hypothetical protein